MRCPLSQLSSMKRRIELWSVVVRSTKFSLANGDTTINGKVSDAMCGAKHQMAGNDASCTRTCVKGGSKYALVVGDKVYTLETSDKAALDKLNELAGAPAKVTGEVKGDTINVKTVAAGS